MTIAKLQDPAAEPEALDFEVELDATLDKVWRALSDPDLVAAWLAPHTVGAALGGPIDCRVLEAQPERLIRYAWRGDGDAGPLKTEILFELTALDEGGVRLRLRHSGFSPAAVALATPRVVSLAAHRKARHPATIARPVELKWAA